MELTITAKQAAQIMGSKGGKKTLKLYKKEYFSNLGKKGAKAKWDKVKAGAVDKLLDKPSL